MKAATLARRSVPRVGLGVASASRRRLMAVVAALVVLAAGYWLWFRDSSFARVEEVYVTGADGPQARAIRSALEEAGLGMTTLHVKMADLRAAVADYPVVRSITARGGFPHKLTIDVQLNLPVAILKTPSGREPVAADGLLLSDVPITNGLPVLTTNAPLPAERVTAGRAFDLVRIVALAPGPLRPRLKSVGFRGGYVADLRNGPELRFGDATRLPAKWIAAARVLAAAGARGARYIDLRLPERPAAGGLPTTSVLPLAPAGETAPPATGATTQATPTTTATAPSQAATTTTETATTAASGAVQNPQSQVETSGQPSTQP